MSALTESAECVHRDFVHDAEVGCLVALSDWDAEVRAEAAEDER